MTRKSGVRTAPKQFKPAKALYLVLETRVNRKTDRPERGKDCSGQGTEPCIRANPLPWKEGTGSAQQEAGCQNPADGEDEESEENRHERKNAPLQGRMAWNTTAGRREPGQLRDRREAFPAGEKRGGTGSAPKNRQDPVSSLRSRLPHRTNWRRGRWGHPPR